MYWRRFFLVKLPQIGVFILIIGIYIVNFLLWKLPLIAFFNSTLLGLLIFIVYLFFSYSRWKAIEIRLEDLNKENRQIKKSLEKQALANQEFMDIIRVWSHQMKIPLSAIDLMTQTVIDNDELKNQIFTLENYLTILLEYQRITNLSTDFRFETVSVNEISKKIVKKYSNFFIQKNLFLKFEGESDWKITTDSRWFELALEQFINNAVKYTKKGGVSIYIGTNQLKIKDSGIGILAEDLPRLFEYGFTGYNGRIQQKSTGLGLYLSRLILDKLDFEVKIESEIEKGTTVIITKRMD